MPRGRGQIPPYGKNFRLDRATYDRNLAGSVYVLKRDSQWFIRSANGSHSWRIYLTLPAIGDNYSRYDPEVATAVSRPVRTLREAMDLLIDGIDMGFYHMNPASITVTRALMRDRNRNRLVTHAL